MPGLVDDLAAANTAYDGLVAELATAKTLLGNVDAIEARIAELSDKNSSEEEVVEEAMDNAEEEGKSIANNNAEVSEEELSLKEKFQKAFSEDNLTINY